MLFYYIINKNKTNRIEQASVRGLFLLFVNCIIKKKTDRIQKEQKLVLVFILKRIEGKSFLE